MASGNIRYRVRAIGNPKKRTVLSSVPGERGFDDEYHEARGATPKIGIEHSLDWLCDQYIDHLQSRVDAGISSPLTLKQRRSQLRRVCAFEDASGHRYGGNHMDAPQEALIALRDALADTPAEADNTMKSLRALYAFALERRIASSNPATGIGKIHKPGGGATPWTPSDLQRYRDTHPAGTMAHRTITLFVFAGCRIGDAVWLGPEQELMIGGDKWLGWQPSKKGSAYTEVPMLPPLIAAVEGSNATYLTTAHGKPFSSPEGLRNRLSKWCGEAEIKGRSSHGIRKAFAELLAESGATQHGIMALMSHTQASTSEVYTKNARRRIMAGEAMRALGSVDW